jgi:hypothetical protein
VSTCKYQNEPCASLDAQSEKGKRKEKGSRKGRKGVRSLFFSPQLRVKLIPVYTIFLKKKFTLCGSTLLKLIGSNVVSKLSVVDDVRTCLVGV